MNDSIDFRLIYLVIVLKEHFNQRAELGITVWHIMGNNMENIFPSFCIFLIVSGVVSYAIAFFQLTMADNDWHDFTNKGNAHQYYLLVYQLRHSRSKNTQKIHKSQHTKEYKTQHKTQQNTQHTKTQNWRKIQILFLVYTSHKLFVRYVIKTHWYSFNQGTSTYIIECSSFI